MNDQLWRGTAFSGQFRVLAVSSTQTAQTMRDLHDLSPVNTLLLGKMIPAVAMLSMDLKLAEGEVSLRVDGDGPLKGALAICTGSGDLRGYALEPRLWLDDAEANLFPVRALGTGTLSVIRGFPNKKPVTGTTVLSEGELALNLAHYFDQSEQIPSVVNLGVLIDKTAAVRASGGFIIQQMPDADPKLADELTAALSRTPNVSDLMDMGLSLPEILKRFVVKESELELTPAGPIQYRCNCSRERFERVLLLLGEEELSSMREGIEPQCHFCNATYCFSAEDMNALIATLKDKP